ncbi:hypothetical protein KK083_07575 [Fulvivirgaceae bacterium PWU4]|uniref:Uncharacterized protein n=1 Tax=Chryseosolibacter histidini TaxID=2782349 RepID=A0AAP2GMA4_9BACT|nr:hypothetical protein [Chryseosolibacter histidini]MBT1696728.1 hypothetical protein [Chryseosolibacter histidini]
MKKETGAISLKLKYQIFLKNIFTSLLPPADTWQMACAALATCSGRIKLGKAVMELEEDVMDEFLE